MASVVPAPVVAGRSTDVEGVVMSAYELYAGRLKAFAMAAVRNGEQADDMVQETFLRLVREVRKGSVPDNVGGWLYRVCGNLIVSRGRRQQVFQRISRRLIGRDTEPSAEASVIQRQDVATLHDALAGLAPDARVALLMAAQGCDAREIGSAIGRTPGAARTFLARSRVRLRELLDSSSSHDR